jgi:tetratricopeptide (TPR) repeat protein
MPDGMNLKKGKADASDDTRHIRSIFELDKLLDKNKSNQLKYQGKYYGDDDHGSVPLIAEYDALHFIFDFYRLKLNRNDFADTTMALADKLEKHYATLSKQMGYRVKPPENQVNNLGYQALNDNHFERAEYFFKSNVANYPESFNVYDSYGDYFVARGDTTNAILYFQKALAVQETPASREKLEALQGVKTLKLSADVLQNYAATFDFNGTTVTTNVKNDALWMQVPGQPEYELLPVKEHAFKIKTLAGYSVLFEMENGKVAAAYSVQPDGTFKATVKK